MFVLGWVWLLVQCNIKIYDKSKMKERINECSEERVKIKVVKGKFRVLSRAVETWTLLFGIATQRETNRAAGILAIDSLSPGITWNKKPRIKCHTNSVFMLVLGLISLHLFSVKRKIQEGLFYFLKLLELNFSQILLIFDIH